MEEHILKNVEYWKPLIRDIETKERWTCCALAINLLRETREIDEALYSDPKLFRERRDGVLNIYENPDGEETWNNLVIGAFEELKDQREGPNVQRFKQLHIFNELLDYFIHLDFFYKTGERIDRKLGKKIITDLNKILIHDLDKINPVMLIGYAEKFNDNVTTSLWNIAVKHHYCSEISSIIKSVFIVKKVLHLSTSQHREFGLFRCHVDHFGHGPLGRMLPAHLECCRLLPFCTGLPPFCIPPPQLPSLLPGLATELGQEAQRPPCTCSLFSQVHCCGGDNCCSELGLYTLQIGCLPTFRNHVSS